jgi:hypothetical protein
MVCNPFCFHSETCPHGIWYRVEEEAVEFSTKADELKGGKVSATEVTGKFLYFPFYVCRS